MKDNILPEKKSGIYQINCWDFEKIYTQKRRRDLETRVKEHFRNIKNGEIEKSAVAAHVWKDKHAKDHKAVLLKQASNKHELTNWENILIAKNKDRIINFEIPPADHLTKKFILNPVEGKRSAPTRSSNQNHELTMRTKSLKALSICSSK